MKSRMVMCVVMSKNSTGKFTYKVTQDYKSCVAGKTPDSRVLPACNFCLNKKYLVYYYSLLSVLHHSRGADYSFFILNVKKIDSII